MYVVSIIQNQLCIQLNCSRPLYPRMSFRTISISWICHFIVSNILNFLWLSSNKAPKIYFKHCNNMFLLQNWENQTTSDSLKVDLPHIIYSYLPHHHEIRLHCSLSIEQRNNVLKHFVAHNFTIFGFNWITLVEL